jgi:MazG family protein
VTESEHRLAREIAALGKTLRMLRSERGCPWDRAQTVDDLIGYLIEESYELLQAEQARDRAAVEEELGDVFFIVVFIHELLLERGDASLAEIVARVHRKIINRHPHVFGATSASNRTESVAEWERIKRSERAGTRPRGRLEAVPAKLSTVRRAQAVQKTAAQVGFDWPDHRGILDKLAEETGELAREIPRGDRERIKDEIGDIFFTVVNLARRLDLDAEIALERATAKFVGRFSALEREAGRRGRELASMSLDEMERIWEENKQTRGRRGRPPSSTKASPDRRRRRTGRRTTAK